MMESIRAWLAGTGLSEGGVGCVSAVLGLAIACVLAWIGRIIARYILLRAVLHVVKKTKYTWDDALVERKVFNRIAHFVPGYVLYATAGVVFAGYETGETLMQLGAMIYMVLVGLLVVDGFLNAVVDIYRTFDFARRMPIRGLIQVVKIVLYLVAGVIVISLLLDKPPGMLLGGMGALTAVLMLVFKDAILGFVAGIQLTANRMVHIGDWIEM
ncbi:MAG: mechanosensitive ion channel, partial [Planctomycetes bacterium]|nr:mechanosensitive ion channel [Planctomycetota bacterium]